MEQTMRLWFEANAPDDWPTVEPCILGQRVENDSVHETDFEI